MKTFLRSRITICPRRWVPDRRSDGPGVATSGLELSRGRWVQLREQRGGIAAQTAVPQADWRWLAGFLQVDADLRAILASFPRDATMTAAAMAQCRGLRVLRQDPWECLASFILSSTKQIVQIQQIIAALSIRWGEPVAVPSGEAPAFAFPTARRLALATEAELRTCKMGFRAPYLLAAARAVASGECNPSKHCHRYVPYRMRGRNC